MALDWFRRFEGAGLDGVMAKRLDAPYRAGERTMIKVKHERTADCVVAGFRWHKKGAGTMIGLLLLGLYDDDHTLHHVGVAAAFTATVRKQLVVHGTGRVSGKVRYARIKVEEGAELAGEISVLDKSQAGSQQPKRVVHV